jgi:hypothetical protein
MVCGSLSQDDDGDDDDDDTPPPKGPITIPFRNNFQATTTIHNDELSPHEVSSTAPLLTTTTITTSTITTTTTTTATTKTTTPTTTAFSSTQSDASSSPVLNCAFAVRLLPSSLSSPLRTFYSALLFFSLFFPHIGSLRVHIRASISRQLCLPPNGRAAVLRRRSLLSTKFLMQ